MFFRLISGYCEVSNRIMDSARNPASMLRQQDNKSTPVPWPGLHIDLSLVNADDMLDDRKPESGPPQFSATGLVDTVKPFEQARLVLLLDTRAVIGHRYPYPITSFSA